MSSHITLPEEDSASADGAQLDTHTEPEDSAQADLRVIIRKLEMPVRPRGVLAE